MWDRICRERYGVEDPKLRRFRYGVQVNSLGLTEPQPENNVQRIVLETLGVTLSKDARARAIQLPAWNEALGLPRPWDQQWSLRIQQILAFESDLLEYDDIFEGSKVIEAKTDELVEAAAAELDDVLGAGRRVRGDRRAEAPPRAQPGRAGAAHRDAASRWWSASTASPRPRPPRSSATGEFDTILKVDHRVEAEQIADVERWRAERDSAAVRRALDELRRVAADDGPDGNLMAATIALAHAGGTTGEWAGALREVFGEYRAPTGVSGGVGRRGRELAPVAAADQGAGRAHRRPAPAARGQARARRALQRRRADRRGGPRRRLRGRSTRASG